MDNTQKTTGSKLKRARELLGWTMEMAAARASISVPTVRNIEQDGNTTIWSLAKLRAAYQAASSGNAEADAIRSIAKVHAEVRSLLP